MLTDFDLIKEKLSIVAKSFVSLGKPLRHTDSYIYIRDTMLLAPGGNKSLKAIGKLYQETGDFAKRELTYEEVNNMGEFLNNDRSAFIEYAIKDAQIVVKHATAMEEFNKSLKLVGIPTTLSSMGRAYVTEE